MEKKTLPDYIKDNDDGTAKITLRSGIDIDGTKVMALVMREPTVEDQLVMEATKGSDAVKEMTIISNLCDIAMADVKKLTTRDYGRVQSAFEVFKD